jgi:phage-related protein
MEALWNRNGRIRWPQRVGRISLRKPLKGHGSAGVLEIVENLKGDTYRAVYTVGFSDAVYVLHCFQKKATRGIATPKPDLDLIESRLKLAETLAKGATS